MYNCLLSGSGHILEARTYGTRYGHCRMKCSIGHLLIPTQVMIAKHQREICYNYYQCNSSKEVTK